MENGQLPPETRSPSPFAGLSATERLLLLLFGAALLAMTMGKVTDTDAWLHLSLGKLIWERGGIPEIEPFCFPILDKPFVYSSWLFGVVLHLIQTFFGFSGISLFVGLVVSAAFVMLLVDALLPKGHLAVAVPLVAVAAGFASLRAVPRPDIVFMFCLTASFLCLHLFLNGWRKALLPLPFIHVFWANCHTSVAVMPVPFLAVLAGGAVHTLLARKGRSAVCAPSGRDLGLIAAAFAASLAASLASPYFLDQFLAGGGFMGKQVYKQEIVELLPPSGQLRLILMGSAACVLLSFLLNWKRFSLADFLLVLPFLYLPFTAQRFSFFLWLTGAPVVARNLSMFLNARGAGGWLRKPPALLTAGGVAVTAGLLVALQIPPLGSAIRMFGLGEYPILVPEGAVRYMDREGIDGRVMTSFAFGQYVIWTGYPRRTVFLDARGPLPADLMEKAMLFRQNHAIWDELYRAYGFESVLIQHSFKQGSESVQGVDVFKLHPDWALVYWDDVSLLFLRRGGPWQALIERDEYREINPDTHINTFLAGLASPEKVMAELRRNIDETGSSLARLLLGFTLNRIGRPGEAMEAFSGVTPQPGSRWDLPTLAWQGAGDALRKSGDTAGALGWYRRAWERSGDASLLQRMGEMELLSGKFRPAADLLEQALAGKADPRFVYPSLIAAYEGEGRTAEAQAARDAHARLSAAGDGKAFFQRALKAYDEKRLQDAIALFNQALAVNPNTPVVYANLGFVYYDLGDLDAAEKHFRQALALAGRDANAHYGLAMIFQKRGDAATAAGHFREYLAIAPSGYFARRAQEALSRMGQ